MNTSHYVSGNILTLNEPIKVELNDLEAVSNHNIFQFIIEQEYPFVVNIYGENDETRSMIVKLDSRGNPIVSYCGYSYPLEVLSEKENLYNVVLLSGLSGKTISTKIPAPMPGLIKVVNVVVGQRVKKGEQLFVLEAMKMENSIKSPSSGIIASVAVQNGGIVDKNAVLCSIEPEVKNN